MIKYLAWCVAVVLTAGITVMAIGAVIPPNDIGGCQYNLSQPTYADGAVIALQCGSAGQLRTH